MAGAALSWAGVCWEGGWHGKGVFLIPQGSVQGSQSLDSPEPHLILLTLALLDLSLPPLVPLADLERDPPFMFSHYPPEVCRGLSSRALLWSSVQEAPLLWPVKQNQMPGKDQDGREPAESRDQGILMTGPRPQFPPVYKEEMDRSVSEDPSLGRYFGLMDFIFYL